MWKLSQTLPVFPGKQTSLGDQSSENTENHWSYSMTDSNKGNTNLTLNLADKKLGFYSTDSVFIHFLYYFIQLRRIKPPQHASYTLNMFPA